MKIAVYAIAKNEAKHVERFVRSCDGADVVLVADTGSTDATRQLLTESAAATIDLNIRPWRFDDARNAALALVPPDIDICVSLDLDEVLTAGWRARIEAAWSPGTTRLR